VEKVEKVEKVELVQGFAPLLKKWKYNLITL
jgi:hypothetical protein